MSNPLLMSSADTGILVVDVQEKLIPFIPDAARMIGNISFLLDVAKILEMYVQATEQYPKGLGPTVAELAAKLPPCPEKLTFSCCGIPEVVDNFHRRACPKVLVVGIETHVCVQQTALDLLNEDFRVFLAADAVACRYPMDHEFGINRMREAGVTITTAESAAFEWAGVAGTPEFKQISRLVQTRMKGIPSPKE